MSLIRRISLWGGPGLGKSTTAALIYCELKKINVEVELVQEYVKELVYEGKKITPYDQLKIFSEQLAREHRILSSDPDTIIVTDCPVSLSISYAVKYGFPNAEELIKIHNSFECDFPSTNILLKRGDCPYKEKGRIENLSQAEYMDRMIETFLIDNEFPYRSYDYDEHFDMLEDLNLIFNFFKK